MPIKQKGARGVDSLAALQKCDRGTKDIRTHEQVDRGGIYMSHETGYASHLAAALSEPPSHCSNCRLKSCGPQNVVLGLRGRRSANGEWWEEWSAYQVSEREAGANLATQSNLQHEAVMVLRARLGGGIPSNCCCNDRSSNCKALH